MPRYMLPFVLLSLFVVGCENKPREALGTLEWDRVNSRAIQSEVITDFFVEEGDYVKKGDKLLQLDDRKQRSLVAMYEADLNQAIWHEKELLKGPRDEEIAEARARLAAADANVMTTFKVYERQRSLRKGDFTSEELLDDAKNSYLNAKAQQEERTETLNKLLAGTRVEQLEQAKAKVESLQLLVVNAKQQLDEYLVVAARTGKVDSFPYKLGDRPPQTAVVCTVLSGEKPWARIYVPEPWRSTIIRDTNYNITIDGQEESFPVKLRFIEAKASFSPYFALTEKDRSYLSYVAEFDLQGEEAKTLSSGTPVQLILEP